VLPCIRFLYDRDRGDPIGNAAYRSLMLLPFTGSVRASAVKARPRRIGNHPERRAVKQSFSKIAHQFLKSPVKLSRAAFHSTHAPW
jgi:hypothetical protein